MIISLKEIKLAQEELKRLLTNESINIKASYILSEISDKLISEINKIESFRQELVRKYGVQMENQLVVPPENMDKFAKELEDLLSTEIDLQFTIIPSSYFGKDFKIAPIDLSKLRRFIKMDKR